MSIECVWLAPYLGRAARQVLLARPCWLVVAFVVECASICAFAYQQRVMLVSAGLRVRLRDALATVFGGTALSVTLPAGSIASFAYTMRRMRSWGASTSLALFALAAGGLLSTAALVILGVLGAGLAGNRESWRWFSAECGVAVLLVTAMIVAIRRPCLIVKLARGTVRVWDQVRSRFGFVQMRPNLDVLARQLVTARPGVGTWSRGLAFAGANWAGDLACLAAACRAVGAAPSLSASLLAYAAGIATATAVPLLPGGLGPVDAAIAIVLHHGGVPVSAAAAGVLLYRLNSFGFVVATGWLVLLSQRLQRSRPRHP